MNKNKQGQLLALKQLVFKSKDGTDLAKKIISCLIDNSEEMRKDVCITLVENREDYNAQEINGAAEGFHDMQSGNCSTHLDMLMELMGSRMHFSILYGDFDSSRKGNHLNADGMFANFPKELVRGPAGLTKKGMPTRYTFWLSKKRYSKKAELIIITREQLEQVNVNKYPSFLFAGTLKAGGVAYWKMLDNIQKYY